MDTWLPGIISSRGCAGRVLVPKELRFIRKRVIRLDMDMGDHPFLQHRVS
jgi:hypothetical protein